MTVFGHDGCQPISHGLRDAAISFRGAHGHRKPQQATTDAIQEILDLVDELRVTLWHKIRSS
jgi:hypothetical protein